MSMWLGAGGGLVVCGRRSVRLGSVIFLGVGSGEQNHGAGCVFEYSEITSSR